AVIAPHHEVADHLRHVLLLRTHDEILEADDSRRRDEAECAGASSHRTFEVEIQRTAGAGIARPLFPQVWGARGPGDLRSRTAAPVDPPIPMQLQQCLAIPGIALGLEDRCPV